jgi:hypothetical protein
MSAAKDALLDIHPDILCLQEVRDWDSVAELVSMLPGFQTSVVSRFREMGSSGPLSIQQTAIASNRPAEAAWSESFKPSPVTPPSLSLALACVAIIQSQRIACRAGSS